MWWKLLIVMFVDDSLCVFCLLFICAELLRTLRTPLWCLACNVKCSLHDHRISLLFPLGTRLNIWTGFLSTYTPVLPIAVCVWIRGLFHPFTDNQICICLLLFFCFRSEMAVAGAEERGEEISKGIAPPPSLLQLYATLCNNFYLKNFSTRGLIFFIIFSIFFPLAEKCVRTLCVAKGCSDYLHISTSN